MLLYERRYSEDVLNIITHTQRSDISLLDKSHYITQMSLLFLCKMGKYKASIFWPESQTLAERLNSITICVIQFGAETFHLNILFASNTLYQIIHAFIVRDVLISTNLNG